MSLLSTSSNEFIYSDTSPHHSFFFNNFLKDSFAFLLILSINILESFSYGILIFPRELLEFTESVSFVDGIHMYVQSTAVAQLIMSSLTSFKGPISAGMMIENIPFMTVICREVLAGIGKRGKSALSTILFCYSLSTFLIGASLYLIGRLRLSNYFKILPRFFLDGLLAGIGIFLIILAVQLTQSSLQLRNDAENNSKFKLIHFEKWKGSLFAMRNDANSQIQVLLSATMGVLIFSVVYFFNSFQFAVPLLTLFFVSAFWIISLLILGKSFAEMCSSDWLFHIKSTQKFSFRNAFNYFSQLNLSQIDWILVIELVPVLLASVIFGWLHLPINIPAFAVTTGQNDTFDFDKEISAHSISNIACAFISFVPNYMVYTTSSLFQRMSTFYSSKTSSYALGLATFMIPYFGVALISLIPKVVLASFMFYLGFDLVWFAGIVPLRTISNQIERIGLVSIVLVCNIWGFSMGIFAGVVLSLLLVCHRTNSYNVSRIDYYNTVLELEKEMFYESMQERCAMIQVTGNLSFLNCVKVIERLEELVSRWESFIIVDVMQCILVDESFFGCLFAKTIEKNWRVFVIHSDNLQWSFKRDHDFVWCRTAAECIDQVIREIHLN